MSILLRLLINAAALWVAIQVVDGISFTGTIPTLLGVALVFGVLNVVLRPILKLLRQLAGEDRNKDDVVDAEHDLEHGQGDQRDQAIGGEHLHHA